MDSDSYPLGGISTIPFDVIEEAPTHDGTICFSAWEDCKAVEERHAKWASNGRPKYSVQIYDKTLSFNNPQNIKALAEHIYKATFETRCGNGGQDYDDRLDVYGLVMPGDTSNEERVKRCIAHQKAEIIACNSAGQSDLGDV